MAARLSKRRYGGGNIDYGIVLDHATNSLTGISLTASDVKDRSNVFLYEFNSQGAMLNDTDLLAVISNQKELTDSYTAILKLENGGWAVHDLFTQQTSFLDESQFDLVSSPVIEAYISGLDIPIRYIPGQFWQFR